MTPDDREKLLRAARRELEASERIRNIGPLELLSSGGWFFELDALRTTPGAVSFPEVTRWAVVVSPRFPWGDLRVYPAAYGGIDLTYPHQRANGPPVEGTSWRRGEVCLERTGFLLARNGTQQALAGDPARLQQIGERLCEWIDAATAGTLLGEGDHFELPDFDPSDDTTIAFAEDEVTQDAWATVGDRCGFVDLAIFGKRTLVARAFLSIGRQVLVAPRWGTAVRQAPAAPQAAWIRLHAMPLVGPYGAPMTWKELASATGDADSFESLRKRVLRNETTEDSVSRLLVGFPVPRRVGEGPSALHWQSIFIRRDRAVRHGFRNCHESRWRQEVAVGDLGPRKKLSWASAENWSTDALAARGRLPEKLCAMPAVLIGAGALGSTLAEWLVRGGLRQLTIIDPERVCAGNLVRHSLLLSDVGAYKAHRLASRLCETGPQTEVVGIQEHFPHRGVADWTSSPPQLLIDTTANDDVIAAMSEVNLPEQTVFLSLSVGRRAARGYAYLARGRSFPADDFRNCIEPELAQDRVDFPDAEDAVWPTVGCWHPIFPARGDRVAKHAMDAIEELAQFVEDASSSRGLAVLAEREPFAASGQRGCSCGE